MSPQWSEKRRKISDKINLITVFIAIQYTTVLAAKDLWCCCYRRHNEKGFHFRLLFQFKRKQISPHKTKTSFVSFARIENPLGLLHTYALTGKSRKITFLYWLPINLSPVDLNIYWFFIKLPIEIGWRRFFSDDWTAREVNSNWTERYKQNVLLPFAKALLCFAFMYFTSFSLVLCVMTESVEEKTQREGNFLCVLLLKLLTL